MAETASAKAPAAELSARPSRPDEGAFRQALSIAEEEHNAVMDRLNTVKGRIDVAMPSKNRDHPSPTQQRRQELISQANEIRLKQSGGKNARTSKVDQIKRLDEQLRSRVAEQKIAKAKVPFKSVDEVDRQIASLESQVNSGSMKLVDEKKALTDMSNLRKLRKNFGQFDDAQKQIDGLRTKIKEIKDSMEDPEQKALSAQYTKIQTELDAIKAEQDEAYKNISSLRDERTKLHTEQQEKFAAIRKIKDDYFGAKKAFMNFEREQREKYRERKKAEQERQVRERKKAAAERVLAEASYPAYQEEIRRAINLVRFLDPSHKTEQSPLVANNGLGAQAQRTVDDSKLKGTRLQRKEDREEEYLPAVKKGKKGKKGGAGVAAGHAKAYSCPPSVVEDCAFVGLDPPMSNEDVAGVIEKVNAKIAHWKADQEQQTNKNIAKAKEEIERLEREEEAEGANGTSNGTSDKVDEVAGGLEEVSVTDKKDSSA
ncbi:hypothetical protein CDD82_7292 [Ophiocordyceps australis]|uniref:Nuclear segregation protein Bfr1 n=1 Tax=Ophiocordyceps australis TaxID=1399860 RepID=A0A2C5XWC2_9HYPO|nr:hypothetical protein CDD82_7292 [Ophiocordyceps australis]